MARIGGYSLEKKQKKPFVMTNVMAGCNFSEVSILSKLVAVCER
jgi:hypothetical protein